MAGQVPRYVSFEKAIETFEPIPVFLDVSLYPSSEPAHIYRTVKAQELILDIDISKWSKLTISWARHRAARRPEFSETSGRGTSRNDCIGLIGSGRCAFATVLLVALDSNTKVDMEN